MTDLWCVHILGPDDLYAAPSRAEAERAVAYMEKFWRERYPEEAAEGLVSFAAAPWPHSPESHARDVGKFYTETGLSEPAAAPCGCLSHRGESCPNCKPNAENGSEQ